jgi:hypothetical protein
MTVGGGTGEITYVRKENLTAPNQGATVHTLYNKMKFVQVEIGDTSDVNLLDPLNTDSVGSLALPGGLEKGSCITITSNGTLTVGNGDGDGNTWNAFFHLKIGWGTHVSDGTTRVLFNLAKKQIYTKNNDGADGDVTLGVGSYTWKINITATIDAPGQIQSYGVMEIHQLDEPSPIYQYHSRGTGEQTFNGGDVHFFNKFGSLGNSIICDAFKIDICSF